MLKKKQFEYVKQPYLSLVFFVLLWLCFSYLQSASALASAAVSRSFQETLLQAPLWSRTSSSQSSLAKDSSTSDAKTGQGYMVLLC